MKKIKIGKLQLDLMDSPADINDARYQDVQNLMFKIYDYVDKPDPFKYVEIMEKAINNNSIAAQHEAFYNFKTSISSFNKESPNTYAFIFALITLEKGEDQNSPQTRDLNYLTEKIDRYRLAGLTAGMCRDKVEAFFLACPELSVIYQRMTEVALAMLSLTKLDYSTANAQELQNENLLQDMKGKSKVN